jgi:hypothetical protein
VSSKLKTRPSSSKKKSNRGTIDYSTSTEGADIFKERWQRLNDLAIKNSAPKQKSLCKVQKNVDDSEVVYHNTSLESKAGKTFFPVLIGHEEYLQLNTSTNHPKPQSSAKCLHAAWICMAVLDTKRSSN